MGVLSGKTAVVTGGTSGIGLAIVELFRHEGAVVLFVGRNTKHGAVIERRLNGSRPTDGAPTARFYACDVSDARHIDTTIRAMQADHPVVDILVNNAGANLNAGTVRDVEVDDFNATIATNLTSYVLFARGFVPAMEQRKNGAVVNIASTMGLRGAPGHLSYTVTKGANITLTQSMALDAAAHNVRVNCIAPGLVDTPATHDWIVGVDAAEVKGIPLGRAGTAREIAQAALFLCSDRSHYITGVVLPVDGGMTVGE